MMRAEQGISAAVRQECYRLVCADAWHQEYNDQLLAILQELLHLLTVPARLDWIVADAGQKPALEKTLAQHQLAPYCRVVVDDSNAGKELDKAARLILSEGDLFISLSPAPSTASLRYVAECVDRGCLPVVPATPEWANAVGGGALPLPLEATPRYAAAAMAYLLETPSLRQAIRRELVRHFREQPGADQVESLPETWRLEGPFDSSYSLAIVNRETARAFDVQGQAVELTDPELRQRAVNRHFLAPYPGVASWVVEPDTPSRPAVHLRNNYPPRVHDMCGTYNLLSGYAWEESTFPPAYVDEFNRHLDGMTVVSTLVRDILLNNGVTVPMAVVGNGVDHILGVSPAELQLETRRFCFLHISSCFPRKGPDVLLEAYGKAFTIHDDVTLLIKTFANPHNTVREQLAACRASNPHYPHVVLIEEDYTDSQLVALYRHADAFVAPSRAEGFGMPFAEAMLFELPVIVTGHGGQHDFCTDETAWLIDYRFAQAESHLGLFHSAWAEPDAGHLALLLKEVHNAPPEVRQRKTRLARQKVEAHYNWSLVAERTRQFVASLSERPVLPRMPRVAWVSTYHSKCGIATYSERLLCAFPEGSVTVLANRDAKPLGNDPDYVQRVWTSGTGAAAQIIEAVRRLQLDCIVIQHNHAFMPLDTVGQLCQELEAENVRVFVTLHNSSDPGNGVSFAEAAPALRHASRILVHGIDDLNRLKAAGLVENAMLFPHGVYPSPSDDTPGLKGVLGLEGKRVLASYGFLMPHKGVKELITAFAELRRQQPDLHLLLCNAVYPEGHSERERQACEALIHQLDLDAHVTREYRFLPDDESLALLQTAEIVVFPYQYTQESASGAVRMGIAARRPVAVTPLDIFNDLEVAVQRLPGTRPEALAEGLAELLERIRTTGRDSVITEAERWRKAHQWSPLSHRLYNLIQSVRAMDRPA